MTRREFVRRYVERRFDRAQPEIDRLVREAERLWTRLSERGYGARQERGPREHLDWYRSLSEQQREWFDRFWNAFAHKHGRNEAAMRWSQINPDGETAEHIIHAAGLEAEQRKQLRDGQTPIMAQGWLNARRWEDHPAPVATAAARSQDEARIEQNRLNAEILHLERLIKRQGNGAVAQQLRDQVDELRGRVAVLRAETDG